MNRHLTRIRYQIFSRLASALRAGVELLERQIDRSEEYGRPHSDFARSCGTDMPPGPPDYWVALMQQRAPQFLGRIRARHGAFAVTPTRLRVSASAWGLQAAMEQERNPRTAGDGVSTVTPPVATPMQTPTSGQPPAQPTLPAADKGQRRQIFRLEPVAAPAAAPRPRVMVSRATDRRPPAEPSPRDVHMPSVDERKATPAAAAHPKTFTEDRNSQNVAALRRQGGEASYQKAIGAQRPGREPPAAAPFHQSSAPSGPVHPEVTAPTTPARAAVGLAPALAPPHRRIMRSDVATPASLAGADLHDRRPHAPDPRVNKGEPVPPWPDFSIPRRSVGTSGCWPSLPGDAWDELGELYEDPVVDKGTKSMPMKRKGI